MPKYFFQPQGPNYRAPNASLYEVATLNDIHTMNFLEYYNSQQGLLILEPQQQIQQWFCCLVRVADGWLYYGAPPNAYSPLTLTDGFSSANVCSIYNNYNNAVVTLGTTTTTNVNFNTLTLAEISQFGSFTTGSQCTAPDNEFGNNTITLYKRVSPPPYLITLYGPGVPLPSASYALATLADVQSEAFGAAYNAAGGINVTGFESDISMCCVLQVTEGWLYNTNPGYYPLSPYTTGLAPNHEACAAFMSSQLSLIGIMGGAEVGFTTLNSTTTSHFTTNSTNPCSSTITSIAILKRLY
ncbi:Hypothetical protein, putative [Bodo saltans]|uniref:Uncharacterized protein n=1 Tax=Bodo saltans TaxID=75058 RepID=A0A0S4JKR4_BODSA|nr:Hypothetical protein, putative [Bodo saltans]|eukprot:CUG91184.1 Hypothetical protein, putative [Bodo saltans]